MVRFVQGLPLGLGHMWRLQREDSQLRHEVFKHLPDVLGRPVAGGAQRLLTQRDEKGRPAYTVSYGRITVELVHTTQEAVIQLSHLRVLESTPPVVGHQTEVVTDGGQPVGIDLLRIGRHEILHRHDGLAQVSPEQPLPHQRQTLVSVFHCLFLLLSLFLLS